MRVRLHARESASTFIRALLPSVRADCPPIRDKCHRVRRAYLFPCLYKQLLQLKKGSFSRDRLLDQIAILGKRTKAHFIQRSHLQLAQNEERGPIYLFYQSWGAYYADRGVRTTTFFSTVRDPVPHIQHYPHCNERNARSRINSPSGSWGAHYPAPPDGSTTSYILIIPHIWKSTVYVSSNSR